MKICAISDTHNQHEKLTIPECDVLIHAGDATLQGTVEELVKFIGWFSKQPAKHKLFVPGNHDFGVERNYVLYDTICDEHDVTLLVNESVYIMDDDKNGFRFYGSPYTKLFGGWAFMKEDVELGQVWNNIPKDVDVLITHGPPFGILDRNFYKEHCGSQTLYQRIKELERLRLHVFGHIHESAGSLQLDKTQYINACNLDGRYTHNGLTPPVITLVEFL